MTFAFYLAAAIAIVSTFMVITRLNAIHALLYLIVSFLAAALILFLVGAPFPAALEVIIYGGAIMVLFVFVVMILGPSLGAATRQARKLSLSAWIGPAVLAAVLLAELLYVMSGIHAPLPAPNLVAPVYPGAALLGPYLLGVELVSMLLLVGLIGAFHLAYRLGGTETSKDLSSPSPQPSPLTGAREEKATQAGKERVTT